MRGLRAQALGLDPAALGFRPSKYLQHVCAGFMELPMAAAVVTVVAIADGTTSLYFANGGGVIGAGRHESVKKATATFLLRLERLLEHLVPAPDQGSPAAGTVRFYARTYDGLLRADASEEELKAGAHPLAPLFLAGHGIIEAVRETQSRP